jgi:hypothetical protein
MPSGPHVHRAIVDSLRLDIHHTLPRPPARFDAQWRQLTPPPARLDAQRRPVTLATL